MNVQKIIIINKSYNLIQNKMFFYKTKLPLIGTIVVANMTDEINDNCIYVTLPEYNNFSGIIFRREFPKKAHQQKKLLSDMKRAGHIVCSVTSSPTFGSDGHPDLIELSIKGADPKYHPDIITRQKNIEKLLKIVKFVSIHFKYNFEDLVQTLHNNEITPLMGTDVNSVENAEGINNYTELYQNYLKNYTDLLRIMKIDEFDKENFDNVSQILGSMIKETNAAVTLDLDLFIWKAERDAVFVLRDVFNHMTQTYTEQQINLRYLGAPSYQLNFFQINISNVDDTLQSVKDSIIDLVTKQGVTGFDLKFDLDKKNIKCGDISISFPYKIDME